MPSLPVSPRRRGRLARARDDRRGLLACPAKEKVTLVDVLDGLPHPTPRDLGLRMPPERAPHAATWTSWPAGEALWEGMLRPVREEFTRLIATIARFEPVVLNVGSETAARDARRRLAAAGVPEGVVTFHPVPLNDVWFRDNGPTFVVDADESVALTDWRFDAWGGKYAWRRDDRVPAAVAEALNVRRFAFPYVMEGGAIEMGDDGTVITTRSCLLDARRNPGLDEAAYERLLREGLGATRLVWLDGGLVDDHTDGHVDTIVRFADERTIVCTIADDDDPDNAQALADNREVLASLRRPDGTPYRIVDLPLPKDRSKRGGVRSPRTYANFYVGNGFVVVPVYADPRDGEALEILAPLFPGREVVGLPATALVTGGGAFHCVTQQQPAGTLLTP